MNTKTFDFLYQLRTAEAQVPRGSTWEHKKGGIYEVLDHQIDCDGGVRVSYERIGGPEYNESLERGLVFSRNLNEWTPDRFKPCQIKTVVA